MQNRVRLCEFGLPEVIETNRINNPTINKNIPTLLINMGIMINEMGETGNACFSQCARKTCQEYVVGHGSFILISDDQVFHRTNEAISPTNA
jgi:hypothetical protein